MATEKWFVVDGDEELGPLGPGGLRKMVRRGTVLPGTMVRREDHAYAIRADHVRGLFDEPRAPRPAQQVQGPFHSPRALGWVNTACMGAWAIAGVLGLFTAIAQRARAIEMSGVFPPPGVDPREHLLGVGAPFLGLGSVAVTALFFATGVPFTWWLWNARHNLPHLITARVRFVPSWTIFCWFVPVLHLLRPYQVVEEIDRLSAEAVADGDAYVRANSALLVPWWICTLLALAATVGYQLMPTSTAEEVVTATLLHVAAAAALIPAAAFGAAVFLRITRLQERAHDAHPQPVPVHFQRHAAPRDDAAARGD